jgi:neutral trehalase
LKPSFPSREYIDLIEEEVIFWLSKRAVHFDHAGETLTLFHYATNTTGARPESFKEDTHLVEGVEGQEAKEALYNNLHSACESGWDFSSRWFKPADEGSIGTNNDDLPHEQIPFFSRFNFLRTYFQESSRRYTIHLTSESENVILISSLPQLMCDARSIRTTCDTF